VQKNLFHRADRVFLNEFKKNYFKLIADEKIDYIFPEMQFNKKTSSFDINLDITKKKRFEAKFGGILSSSPVNEAFVGLQYNSLSAKAVTANVNSYFGRFYNSVQGDVRIDFSSTMPFYLRGTTSYSQWNYFKTQTYFIGDKSPSYLVREDTHSDACIGFPARNNGRFEAGATVAHLRSDYYQTNYFSRLDTTDRNFFDLISGHLLFDRNTLKNKQFASLGTRLLGKINYVLGKETNYPGSTSDDTITMKKNHQWYQFRLSYENFFGHFGWYRLGLFSELHLSNQTLFANYTASILAAPAFEPVPECKTIFNPRFRAYNFAGFGLKNLFIINKNFDFRLEAYAFQPYEEILPNDDMTARLGKRFERRYFMGMAALVFQTPVGPVSLCLNYYDKAITHVNKFSLMFSFGYLIFNPKAIE
jgi:NTE family protein